VHRQPRLLLAVAAGGALGAPARYGFGLVVPASSSGFPTATFLINVSGCFALGLLVEVLTLRGGRGGFRSRYARPFAGTGFLGAWTTYSTFAVETDQLFVEHRVGVAVLYALASLLLGLVAVVAGIRFAVAVVPGRVSSEPGP
jgi:CrcB protein